MTAADIKNKIYYLTKTNSTSFPAADILIAINNAYERVGQLILRADAKWQWDDTNQTDLPNATTDLVSGQQDYSLTSTHLTIDRVEIKDAGGNWHLLTQIDQQELKRDRCVALGAYQSTSGTPNEYDLIGSSVFLYPKPNYNSTAGLKIYFTRGPALYTSGELSTGTKQPGFNSLFHDLIPLHVSYEYALANGQNMANGLLTLIQQKEQALNDFYGLRNRDKREGFRITTDSNK
jgi:hypothetical protein